jgi:SAM-dependent methyltransferase
MNYCPVCERASSTFLPFGLDSRPNAACPACGSLERHRLLWMYLKEQTSFFDAPIHLLHVAPEPCFQNRIKACVNIEYFSCDLECPLADVAADLIDLPFPSGSFDVILCVHVLEHIPDDRLAMAELCRVLKPGGWAILQVPVWRTRPTFEDPSIVDPKERERVFGWHDHVRTYGFDYSDRLEDSGFSVRIDEYGQRLTDEVVRRCRVWRDDDIYLCTKPAI